MLQITRKLLMLQNSNSNSLSEHNDDDDSLSSITKFEGNFDDNSGRFKNNLDKSFYLISSNILCKIGEQSIPVEISIVELSFNSGITKYYHKILSQKIPKGLRYECQVQQMRHKIPVDIDTDKLDNEVIYRTVYGEIVEFMGNQSVATLLCDDEHVEQNSSIVNLLSTAYRKQNNEPSNNNFQIKIVGCKKMARYFYDTSGNDIKFEPELLSKLLLKSTYDCWIYNHCNHHKIIECNYCSLDYCFKMAYAFIYTMAVINDLTLDQQIPNISEIQLYLSKIVSKYRKLL